jgi:hypothetical protein
LTSPIYEEWNNTRNSKLWLQGKPGCGKTVLSSTVIEDISRRCLQLSKSATIFFYFRYDYKPTREHDNQYSQMLRSLIVQLLYQTQSHLEALDELYDSHLQGQRQPSDADLATTFSKLLPRFSHVFLVLDALDECDEIRALLTFLVQFPDISSSNIHLLFTSRKEVLIRESLDIHPQICLQEAGIADDIHAFLIDQLESSEFAALPADLRLEIIWKLSSQADEMSV